MKKLFLISITILFPLVSCEDAMIEPELIEQLNFLELPDNPALADTTRFDNYYLLRGSYGTTIQFDRQFSGGPFGSYSISASLTIEAGTIPATDSLMCLMAVYLKNTCIHITPIESYYAHPFKLTIKYTGLDLTQLDPTNLQFAYTNEKGVNLEVMYDSIFIDFVTGTLEVVNAVIIYDPKQVPDAKYGWVRKSVSQE